MSRMIETGAPLDRDQGFYPEYLKYGYFDTPDDQDLIKKAICLLKKTAVVFGFSAAYDVSHYTIPTANWQTASIMGRWAVPALAIPVVYPSVVAMSMRIRNGKDTAMNHMIAGGLCGGTLLANSQWRRMYFTSTYRFFFGAYLGGALCYFIKHMRLFYGDSWLINQDRMAMERAFNNARELHPAAARARDEMVARNLQIPTDYRPRY